MAQIKEYLFNFLQGLGLGVLIFAILFIFFLGFMVIWVYFKELFLKRK